MAKCPVCRDSLLYLNEQPVEIGPQRRRADSVAYTCPKCDAVLGFGPDMDEIENRIRIAIGKAPGRQR